MNSLFQTVAAILLTAAVGHWLLRRDRAEHRRREFREKLHRLRADAMIELRWMDLARNADLWETCRKIRADIPRRRRARFDALCDELWGQAGGVRANGQHHDQSGQAALQTLLDCAR